MSYQLIPLDAIPAREREAERLERGKYADEFTAYGAARYELVSAGQEQMHPISRAVRYSEVKRIGCTLTRDAAHALARELESKTERALCVLHHAGGVANSALLTDHWAMVAFPEPPLSLLNPRSGLDFPRC